MLPGEEDYLKKLAALVLVMLFQSVSPLSAQTKIKLLVLLDTSSLPRVMHATGSDNVGLFWQNVFTETARISAAKTRNEEYTTRLQNAVGPYPERRQVSIDQLTRAFSKFNSVFELGFPAPDQAATYLLGDMPDFKKVVDGEWRFVLVLSEEFCGLATQSGLADSLSAATIRKYELYDAASKTKLAHGKVNSAYAKYYSVDAALANREIFVTDYPEAVRLSSDALYGELNRKDALHQIAASVGLGDQVPAIGSILEAYAKRFKYSIELADGWRKPRFPGLIHMKKANPYLLTVDPEQDVGKIGMTAMIDLLIDAFAQKVSTADEYASIYFQRLAEQGYNLESLKKYDGLSLREAWVPYIFDNTKSNGNNVTLFRKVGDDYLLVYEVWVIGGMQIFEKHKAEIEYMVNNSKFETRSQ